MQPSLARQPALSPALATALGSSQFRNCQEVNNYFAQRKNQHFLAWFNAVIAGRGGWSRGPGADIRLVDTPANRSGFDQFWDLACTQLRQPITPLSFACIMGILANEVSANFTPQSERMGRSGHPGMAYLFNSIPGVKRSYNTLPENWTAYRCFRDPDFLTAHQQLPYGRQLANTTDQRWAGEAYPAGMPVQPDEHFSGMITQADFMKFRGRGFIQTTNRANYKHLIQFVQSYAGPDAVLNTYRQRWQGRPLDAAASRSTNTDWDTLFQNTGLIIAVEAMRLHHENSGRYLALSTNAAVLSSEAAGSIYYMGLRISGAQTYAERYYTRMHFLLTAMG